MNHADTLRKNLEASMAAKRQLLQDEEQVTHFANATQAVVGRYRAGGRICIAGNGGSAADARHLAAEFVSKLARDRAPLPAKALADYCIIAPGAATSTIQEVHIVLAHSLCECVERAVFGN